MQALRPQLKPAAAGLRALAEKAGATPRLRGRAWMSKRADVLARDRYACTRCGLVSLANEIDHEQPLEQGGSHDDDNLRTLCHECHAAKSAAEQRARHGAGGIESLPALPPGNRPVPHAQIKSSPTVNQMDGMEGHQDR